MGKAFSQDPQSLSLCKDWCGGVTPKLVPFLAGQSCAEAGYNNCKTCCAKHISISRSCTTDCQNMAVLKIQSVDKSCAEKGKDDCKKCCKDGGFRQPDIEHCSN